MKMPAKPKKFIQKALSKPGSKGKLHRELGVPEGKKIPAKKMEKAEHSSNPKIRKQANFAKTLRGLRK
jgi:hypothetical protein